MNLSKTLTDFLSSNAVKYSLVSHPLSHDSHQSAQQAYISSNALAKAVVLNHDGKLCMVVIPTDEHVDLALMRRMFNERVELVHEEQLKRLFSDCQTGAIPPVGAAWALDTYLDKGLLNLPEVFFEAGDHHHLVKVSGKDFERLLADAEQGHYAQTL